jgi:hypothetical protein
MLFQVVTTVVRGTVEVTVAVLQVILPAMEWVTVAVSTREELVLEAASEEACAAQQEEEGGALRGRVQIQAV